jgi:ribosome recycling factor
VHVSARVETVDPFERALVKLVQVLEKVDATSKREDANPEATKHVEAEKQKLRALKLEYKLVDEVYVTYYATTILLTSLVQLG